MKLSTTDTLTKVAAFDLALRLKAGDVLTDCDKDRLINYFAPPLNKAKTPEAWVASACGVKGKETRQNLCLLWVVDGVAYGSDGKRVHWTQTSLTDGAYNPKTLMCVETDLVLPPFLKIIEVNLGKSKPEVLTEEPHSRIEKLDFIVPIGEDTYFLGQIRGAFIKYPVTIKQGSQSVSGSHDFGSFIVMARRR